jgi:hypothetical protein
LLSRAPIVAAHMDRALKIQVIGGILHCMVSLGEAPIISSRGQCDVVTEFEK